MICCVVDKLRPHIKIAVASYVIKQNRTPVSMLTHITNR